MPDFLCDINTYSKEKHSCIQQWTISGTLTNFPVRHTSYCKMEANAIQLES